MAWHLAKHSLPPSEELRRRRPEVSPALQVEWVDLGLIDYDSAFAVQELLHQRRRSGEGKGVILFQENPPTITRGRAAADENLLATPEALSQLGVALRDVSRGGDISFHGPGQLVISPILKLGDLGCGVHKYVWLLEQTVINLLAGYHIQAGRIDGASGVWIGGQNKIAALGIAVKSGITQHGTAINVCPDLSFFNLIVPCGLRGKGVTSMEAETGMVRSLTEIRDHFLAEFSRMFEVDVAPSPTAQQEVNDATRCDHSEVCRGRKNDHIETLALPQRRQG